MHLEYTKTHPWIKFEFKVDTSDYRFWLDLGEVSSKCEHLSGVPLGPDVAKKLNQIFLAKGVLATTAIEGNTLSEEQVLRQIKDSTLELPPSQEYLKQEIDNIIKVCNEEIQIQISDNIESPILCLDLIKQYNKKILEDLDMEEGVIPGELRPHSVVVGNVYRGAPVQDCEFLLNRMCEWLNGSDFKTDDKDMKTAYAVIKAIIAHVYLAWIHPFGDGNGRTARLVEFHILFSSGIPLPTAHLLSDHYNRTRTRYYRELDHASKSGGDLMPFLRYAVRGLLDGLRDQINKVRDQQMKVAWHNFVHEKFKDKKTSIAQKRRRDLVLELSNFGEVSVSEIEDLSVKLAKIYSSRERLLQRDLNAVSKMELIERTHHGRVRARKEIIQAFLPVRIKH